MHRRRRHAERGRGRLQRHPLLDRAHQRKPTGQSELGVSVQIHPRPPLSVSPGRPTASKEGRIEPQPFTTSVGGTTRPRLLVLDEPANGLDPAGSRHVHHVLTGLAADGTSVVLSSHRMDDLAALCGEVTLLAAGRVVFSGPVGKLVAETDELDYRLRTSDPAAARRVAAETPGLCLLPDDDSLT